MIIYLLKTMYAVPLLPTLYKIYRVDWY